MELLLVAKITKPVGLKGEMRAFSLTSFPKDRFKKGRQFFLKKPGEEETKEVTLSAYHNQGEFLVLHFAEIDSIEAAEPYRNYEVYMDKALAPMPKDTYRYEDLKGMEAYDDEGNKIGEVLDVTAFSPKLNLKLKSLSGKVFYVPFIDIFVGKIDLEKKTVNIHVCEGML